MPHQPPEVPNCGILFLKNGADGHVTLSVGSCDGLAKWMLRQCGEVGNTEALVVTAIASLKDFHGKPLYTVSTPPRSSSRATRPSVPRLMT